MKKSFKTLVAVVCAALTFGLTSCSKDAEDLIIGSWEFVSMDMSMSYGDQNHNETITPDEGESTTYTFKKDGTMQMTDVSADGTETENGTYTVDDDQITITSSKGEVESYTITKIDKKEMVWYVSESRDGYSASVTINFKKK